MTVAEAVTKAYYPDYVAEFRINEREAAVDRTEASLLWSILVECGQEKVPLFADSIEKMKAVCEGTTGLRVAPAIIL